MGTKRPNPPADDPVTSMAIRGDAVEPKSTSGVPETNEAATAPRDLPSLALEAIFDAYFERAFAPSGNASAACLAHKRRWLACHASLVTVPEFRLAAERFVRAHLPTGPRLHWVGATRVATWEGCDLGAPWVSAERGTLTLVGSRDCGGKHAAACDVVCAMAGQYKRLYIVRATESPCRIAPTACAGMLASAGDTIWVPVASDADIADAVTRIARQHGANGAETAEPDPGRTVVLLAACGRYFVDASPVLSVDRLAAAIDVAKQCGVHVVMAAGGSAVTSTALVAAIDRLVLVAPSGAESHESLARLFAPAAACLPSVLVKLVSAVERYDALVFERGCNRPISIWARRRVAR